MDAQGEFLLSTYRSARGLDPAGFKRSVLGRLRTFHRFDTATWGEGFLSPATHDITATGLHLEGVDPQFAADWAGTVSKTDHAIPLLLTNLGHTLRISVPTFYSKSSECAEIGRRHQIQALSAIVVPTYEAHGVQWLGIYRSQADDLGTDAEAAWLDWAVPHLVEASLVNGVLNGNAATSETAERVAVAFAHTGELLQASKPFLAAIKRAPEQFDGKCFTKSVREGWTKQRVSVLNARGCCIEARRVGEVVFLRATQSEPTPALTSRQRQIATMYAEGMSQKEIARAAGIAPATVRNHLASVFAVLGVHNKIHLAMKLKQMDN